MQRDSACRPRMLPAATLWPPKRLPPCCVPPPPSGPPTCVAVPAKGAALRRRPPLALGPLRGGHSAGPGLAAARRRAAAAAVGGARRRCQAAPRQLPAKQLGQGLRGGAGRVAAELPAPPGMHVAVLRPPTPPKIQLPQQPFCGSGSSPICATQVRQPLLAARQRHGCTASVRCRMRTSRTCRLYRASRASRSASCACRKQARAGGGRWVGQGAARWLAGWRGCCHTPTADAQGLVPGSDLREAQRCEGVRVNAALLQV